MVTAVTLPVLTLVDTKLLFSAKSPPVIDTGPLAVTEAPRVMFPEPAFQVNEVGAADAPITPDCVMVLLTVKTASAKAPFTAPLSVKSPVLPLIMASAPKVIAPDKVAAVLVLLYKAPEVLIPVPERLSVLARLYPAKSNAAPLTTVTWP